MLHGYEESDLPGNYTPMCWRGKNSLNYNILSMLNWIGIYDNLLKCKVTNSLNPLNSKKYDCSMPVHTYHSYIMTDIHGPGNRSTLGPDSKECQRITEDTQNSEDT